ncbi:hypothetical protein HPB50_014971 [Hyalomma asiaticum]|uniref:Uncharacterized protein n=1 Tax=Hyalomma asiaticum TaxID=266040 RepID=A0ACB7SN96_HYAAI|nr:hypothetical protein HPB50_014971 [Hyalomma asiaticum]
MRTISSFARRAMEGWADAFQNYDPNDQGKISCNVFHQALASLGYNMSEDDVKCLLGTSECLGRDCDALDVPTKQRMDLLKFKFYIATCLKKDKDTVVKKRGRPSSSVV